MRDDAARERFEQLRIRVDPSMYDDVSSDDGTGCPFCKGAVNAGDKQMSCPTCYQEYHTACVEQRIKTVHRAGYVRDQHDNLYEENVDGQPECGLCKGKFNISDARINQLRGYNGTLRPNVRRAIRRKSRRLIEAGDL